MKKILCLLSATLFALSSCTFEKRDDSKKDKKSNPKDNVLPKTVENGRIEGKGTFSYDGNKIKNITYDNGKKRVFTYAGNTITKVENYDKNNVVQLTTTLTYNNNKLKSYLETQTDSIHKVDYTYNSDGTISAFSTRLSSKGEETKESSVYTLNTEGDIIKIAYSDGGVLTFEYDVSKMDNPYKNILGYTLLLTANVFDQDINSNYIAKTLKKIDKNNKIILSGKVGNIYPININIYPGNFPTDIEYVESKNYFITDLGVWGGSESSTTYSYTYNYNW